MATKEPKQEVLVSQQMPAFLAEKMNQPARGAEEVSAEDLVIPRLEVCQALSACRDEEDPNYIEGIKEGDLYNNLTREVYGREVLVIPVVFEKEYLIWKDRKQGGGFRGAYKSMAEAQAEVSAAEDGEHLEISDTSQHYCLIVKGDGSTEEVVISMAKSKRKVSRTWNSLMRLNGGDTFTRVYGLSGVSEKNNDGDKFYNLSVRNVGYVSQSQYETGESLYNSIKGGERKADYTMDADVVKDEDEI